MFLANSMYFNSMYFNSTWKSLGEARKWERTAVGGTKDFCWICSIMLWSENSRDFKSRLLLVAKLRQNHLAYLASKRNYCLQLFAWMFPKYSTKVSVAHFHFVPELLTPKRRLSFCLLLESKEFCLGGGW